MDNLTFAGGITVDSFRTVNNDYEDPTILRTKWPRVIWRLDQK